MKIMAIDYGDARTGVAISDALGWMTGQTAVIHSWKPEKTAEEVLAEAKAQAAELLAEARAQTEALLSAARSQAEASPDRKSTRLNSSHRSQSRMPSSA